MLELDHLVIAQGDFRLTAHFKVARGSRVAILGPSGAGKSTLLSVIAGFFPQESGRIVLDGREISSLPPGARPLSILFQDQNLFPHMTVAENAGLGISPALRLSPEERAGVDKALARMGLQDLRERLPGSLSGGQQSRVALARALLRARPMLLLDEPFAALGPALKHKMLELVIEIADATGATILMVTHDPGDAVRLAGQTVLVARGVAAAPRETTALFANPPPELTAYLGPA